MQIEQNQEKLCDPTHRTKTKTSDGWGTRLMVWRAEVKNTRKRSAFEPFSRVLKAFFSTKKEGETPLAPITRRSIWPGVVDDDGVGALFGFEEVALGEVDADVFFGLEEAEDLGLIFEVGAGGVAEGVAGAAILLMEEVADAGRVFGCDAE